MLCAFSHAQVILFLNDSPAQSILAFPDLPIEVSRDIIYERRKNSSFVSWNDLTNRVPSMTRGIVKKMKKLGVKLSKGALITSGSANNIVW